LNSFLLNVHQNAWINIWLSKFCSFHVRKFQHDFTGEVKVNEKVVNKAAYKLEIGDTITALVSETNEEPPKEQNIALDVIFEDENVAVINKPAGLVVQPGAGNAENTLVNALL
jgi:23S rRNA-/tRNA-specific pseudouridylate synthase